MQPDPFIAAVHSAPFGDPSRLVYADWLEERGDARGELIRIEDEMRQLPAFTDQYWRLKARRNELRACATADWLATMGYGRNTSPVFSHGVPDYWKGRWRLIREVVERWQGHSLSDVGGHAAEVQSIESRLVTRLSPAVQEWVAFIHDLGWNATPERRWGVTIEALPEFEAVSLMLSPDRDLHLAVRCRDLELSDPPVFELSLVSEDEGTFAPVESRPFMCCVTSYVLEMVLGWVGAGGGFNVPVASPQELIGRLEATFPSRAAFDESVIYEGNDIMAWVRPPYFASDAPGKRLTVRVAGAMCKEAVPAFLWEYTRNGGGFYGLFTPTTVGVPI